MPELIDGDVAVSKYNQCEFFQKFYTFNFCLASESNLSPKSIVSEVLQGKFVLLKETIGGYNIIKMENLR